MRAGIAFSLVAMLAVIASTTSSYGQDPEGTLYYGTISPSSEGDGGPAFGTIDPTNGWELNFIAVTAEPDGTFPRPSDGSDGTDIDNFAPNSRYRGLAYNSKDGELYGVLRGWRRGGDPDMIQIDPKTGQASDYIVDNTGPVHASFTYDPVDDVFWSTNDVPGNTLGFLASDAPGVGTTRIDGGGTLDGGFFAIAATNDGTIYSIGDYQNAGLQALVTIDKLTGTVDQIVNEAIDDGFFPSAQAMTVYGNDFLVVANNEGSTQSVGGPLYGGFELWRVSMDGNTVELLNGNYADYVDAIAFVPANGNGGDPVPRPGDANNDGSVTTDDVVAILADGLFETGRPATFAQGDFDGDGVFGTGDIVAMLAEGLFETGPYRALQDPPAGTSDVVVNYDATTGDVSVDATQPITSISLESESGIFTGADAANLGGPFDVDTDLKVFKAVFGSDFSNVEFGAVAAAGLGKDFLLNDLTASGSLAGGGGTYGPDVQLNYIPEPSTVLLLGLGLGLVGCIRRRR